MTQTIEQLLASFKSGNQTPDQKEKLADILSAAAESLRAPKPAAVSFREIARKKQARVDSFAAAMKKGKEDDRANALAAGGWVLASNRDSVAEYYLKATPTTRLKIGNKTFSVTENGEVKYKDVDNENLISYLKKPKTQSNATI